MSRTIRHRRHWPEVANALFEIGCEELPVDYVSVERLAVVEAKVRTALTQARLSCGDVKLEATPRRLTLFLQALALRQPDENKKVTGPQASVAYDGNGNLTPAGEGFLRKHGLEPGQVKIENDRLCAEVKLVGQEARQILPELFLNYLQTFDFPKTMRWENSGARFARPIRWLLALLGAELIPLQYAGVTSGRVSWLHPLKRPRTAEIRHADHYLKLLAQGWVTVSTSQRRHRLQQQLNTAAQKCGGRLVTDEHLLDRVALMVEHPGTVTGAYSEHFLTLPREIVVTTLREHQRFFAVEDDQGRLLPYFLAVHDNPLAKPSNLRPGCERVLTARLKDAEFFYREDLKRPLVDLVPELGRVLWIQGLGSLLDKTNRLEHLAGWLAQRLEPGAAAAAREAAHLAKADLITNMVQEKEFTALQGVMGTYYALAQGVAEASAAAIREQYLPRGAEDGLPRTAAGAMLAMAEKTDHLLGCWGAGFVPTGSKDPYALRRAAQGLLAIALAHGYHFPLSSLLEESCRLFSGFGDRRDSLVAEVKTFIQGRLESELAARGLTPDLIQAVLGVWWDDLAAVVKKAEVFRALRQEPGFNERILTFARVVNILPKGTPRSVLPSSPEQPVWPERMEHEAERELLAASQATGQEVSRLVEAAEFQQAFAALSTLKEPVDRFFDQVMVMDERPEQRENRLNLLYNLARRIWLLADFSKVNPSNSTPT
ncbi:MAG: glycine--tRNA ligase subunit beta [candidate division FCPU426 bacterium]